MSGIPLGSVSSLHYKEPDPENRLLGRYAEIVNRIAWLHIDGFVQFLENR